MSAAQELVEGAEFFGGAAQRAESALNLVGLASGDAGATAGRLTTARALIGASDASSAVTAGDGVMNQQFAAMSARNLTLRAGAPTPGTINFDSADPLGRIYTGARVPLAVVAKVPTNPAEPFSFGSGFAVRDDGLLMAARHPFRGDGIPGRLFAKFFNQPGRAFEVGVMDENKADDLLMLRPMAPLGRRVPFVPLSQLSDTVAPRSQLVTIGTQNAGIDATGRMSAETTISQGQMLDRVPVRFQGEAPTERIRSTVLGEYGMSGGPTYELRSGRIVGSMLGGNDYSWSGLAPSNRLRAMISRNLSRP